MNLANSASAPSWQWEMPLSSLLSSFKKSFHFVQNKNYFPEIWSSGEELGNPLVNAALLTLPTASAALAPTQLIQGCGPGGAWCAPRPSADFLNACCSASSPSWSCWSFLFQIYPTQGGLCPRSTAEEMRRSPHIHTD